MWPGALALGQDNSAEETDSDEGEKVSIFGACLVRGD